MAGPAFSETVYTTFERHAVIALVAVSFLSLVALLYLLVTIITYSKKYANTHFLLYFLCLLLADVMLSLGSVMSIAWVKSGGVYDGAFCAAQGGIKQGGSIAAAFWNFVISWQVFNMLFRRQDTPKAVRWGVVFLVWSFVFIIVFVGPVALENEARGHFFGISGAWCWITQRYQSERILMEYLFELLSVFASSVLYTATLLRARGNVLRVEGRWKLRFLPAKESWKLEFARDFTDSASLRLVQHMIWYPAVYAICILPIVVVRMCSIVGLDPPFAVTAVAACIFNLSGFVDVVLFFTMHRVFPEPESLPVFARRKTIDPSVIQTGITPFTLNLSEPDIPEKAEVHCGLEKTLERRGSISAASINSLTPLRAS
ncbi:hypothetical protein R3P38DRAFT_2876296 [Favolaschia claudopus]|uniref:G-protein coupled receptors family 2 profile 2 domain-containing protein n=1 Tax=Favolaschia claudopus TaxID=2862362 RepID=A0AAW0D8Y1_9AGAR